MGPGLRTVTGGHSIEAAGRANEEDSQLAMASTPLNTDKYYCSQSIDKSTLPRLSVVCMVSQMTVMSLIRG